ncbi:MAG: hypothetical protein KDK37_15465 [Leptospiraceae bacterium]|nr:hypothetical protein [Leptospiraceae bacterium]
MEKSINDILSAKDRARMDQNLQTLWVFFDWAVIVEGRIEMASRTKPTAVPPGAELIRLDSLGRKQ